MDLFNHAFDAQLNLLPHDGQVNYHGCIINPAQADAYFTELYQILAWQHDQVRKTANSCLANLYDGQPRYARHSDFDAALGKNTTIASMSFGAERKFLSVSWV